MKTDELQTQAAAGETPARGDLSPAASSDTARPYESKADVLWPYLRYDRRDSDRRDRPTSFWGSLLSPRRRSGGRRYREGRNIYVDRYRKSDLLLLASVFGLNIADALFTLIWVRRGGSEGNPIMDWFLQQGELAFLAQKCLVVGLWLVILVVHKNFQIARTGLWLLLALYGSIFVYHIFLQVAAVPIAPPPIQ